LLKKSVLIRTFEEHDNDLYDLIDLNLNSHFGTQIEYSVTYFLHLYCHVS